MKIRSAFTAIVLAFVACDEPASDPNSGQALQTAATGTLSLNLVGVDSDGRAYRLRNATFHVQGLWSDLPYPYPDAGAPFSATLSSESDLDAPVLSLTVTPGYYNVSLSNPGWYLERRTNGIWQRVEQVALLSAPQQGAYIVDRGASTVSFRFGVDGKLIDFRSGDLRIGISIEQPGEGADAGFGGTTGGGFFGGATSGGSTDGGFFGGATSGGSTDGGFAGPSAPH
jgi:hypothetical protein